MICVFVSGLTPELPSADLFVKQSLLFNSIVRLAIAKGFVEPLYLLRAKDIASRIVTRFYDVNPKSLVLCVGVGDSKLDGSLHCTISPLVYTQLVDYCNNENAENGYSTINFGGFDTELVSEVLRLLLTEYMALPTADSNLVRDIQSLCMDSLSHEALATTDFMLSNTGPESASIPVMSLQVAKRYLTRQTK